MGILVFTQAGQETPTAYLQKVLDTKPSCAGSLVLDKVQDQQVMWRQASEGCPTLDDLKELGDQFKNNDRFIWAGDYQEGFQEGDLQPFVLINDSEGENPNPLLVAFLIGNFPAFVKTDSAHPAEFHAFTDVLQQTVYKAFTNGGDDPMAAVRKELDDPLFIRQLGLLYQGKGAVVVVDIDGKIVGSWTGTKEEFPWGWTTNTLGYVEGQTVMGGPMPEAKPKSKFVPTIPGMGAAKAAVNKVVAAVNGEKLDKPPTTAVSGPTVVQQTFSAKDLWVKADPAKHNSNNKRRDFYSNVAGHVPKDIADCPWAQLNKTAAKRKGIDEQTYERLRILPNPYENVEAPAKDKDITSKIIKPGDPEPTVHPLSAEQKKNIVEQFLVRPTIKASFDQTGKMIPDPKTIQAIEAKLEKFSESIGRPGELMSIAHWPNEEWLILGKIGGMGALQNALIEFKLAWLKSEAENKALRDKYSTSGTTVQAVEAGAAQKKTFTPTIPGAKKAG